MGDDVEDTGSLASAARPAGETVAAVIVAAGRGERAGQRQGPKQYRAVGGEAILARTLRAFMAHEAIGRIVLVIHHDDERMLAAACGDLSPQVEIVHGGKTRQDSVRLGLRRLADDPPASVLIQDGVRPFTDAALIDRVIAELDGRSAVLPAVPVAETLKREAADGTVFETVPRTGLHAAQTPQAFPFGAILAAHDMAHAEGRGDFTDDASIAEWTGIPVRLVPGSPDNVKITWQRDIELADLRLRQPSGYPDVRTGNGYDVHAFAEGESVTLCGIAIPHDRKLLGHSDADVALHALTDALLATCGAGDIGAHFPPSDPQWKGAASRVFVEHAAAIVRGRGGRIANADVTLIAEAPKIGPHRAAMTESLASMLRIDAGRISVKATTNERLGFIGRAEGIAAIATATVVYPGELPE